MKTAEVVKSMAELLRGVPMTLNGPAVYGIVTQIRGDWKWQRDTWCSFYWSVFFFHWLITSWSVNGTDHAWSFSFPPNMKKSRLMDKQFQKQFNTAQNVQSMIHHWGMVEPISWLQLQQSMSPLPVDDRIKLTTSFETGWTPFAYIAIVSGWVHQAWAP